MPKTIEHFSKLAAPIDHDELFQDFRTKDRASWREHPDGAQRIRIRGNIALAKVDEIFELGEGAQETCSLNLDNLRTERKSRGHNGQSHAFWNSEK